MLLQQIAAFPIAGMLRVRPQCWSAWCFIRISPFMGFNATLKGMMVMIFGGLGNLLGAAVGGIVIGLVETLSVAYWSLVEQNARQALRAADRGYVLETGRVVFEGAVECSCPLASCKNPT